MWRRQAMGRLDVSRNFARCCRRQLPPFARGRAAIARTSESRSASTLQTARPQASINLYIFSDEAFRPLRDQFVASLSCAGEGIHLREARVQDLGAVPHRAAGGKAVYLYKTRLLLAALEETAPGEVMLISDVDVQFFGDVLPYVWDGIDSCDVCFQREFSDIGANIGFVAVRRTDASVAFWREVLDRVLQRGGHDQRFANDLLYGPACDELNLRWRRFAPEIWSSSQVFGGGQLPEGMVLHHANWIKRSFGVTYREGASGATDPSPKLEQLEQVRRLRKAGDRDGQAAFARDLADDHTMTLYYRRAFGDLRRGVEWSALPDGHPARPGGSRRS
eukprot:TRINITY_DN27131_c0_g1_i1.p1 TRINITY_DN27131_c0_g1~~TRINITY_DN27131_c0_g1_i1.p1  ORF type:complete len:334 (-),score=64.19 TRINITY_DN27131_c0_g1_i1:95-1096(-)